MSISVVSATEFDTETSLGGAEVASGGAEAGVAERLLGGRPGVGGDRTDTSLLYAGSRAFGVQDGQRQTRQDDRAVRFTLSRPL